MKLLYYLFSFGLLSLVSPVMAENTTLLTGTISNDMNNSIITGDINNDMNSSTITGEINTEAPGDFTVLVPCTPASVANGSVDPKTCQISCNNGYTLNGSSCNAANKWGGSPGGWGGGSTTPPQINTGDQKTLEKEEKKPEETPKKETSPQISTPDTNEALIKEFRAEHQNNPERLAQLETALASVADSTATTELKQAYTYAYLRGITTMNTIENASLDRGLTRAEMAKMMAVYATQVLDQKPLKTDVPLYQDLSDVGGDLPGYIQLAYQLQIMGVDANGNAIPQFNPHGLVSRAEFATVLSRVMFGNKYNQAGADYYSAHLTALKNAGILSNTDPNMGELRGWVMLMLMRTENIK